METHDILVERGKQYGGEDGSERNMHRIVTIFNELTGLELTVLQGWQFMVCLKLVRFANKPDTEDSVKDLLGYAALAAEEASDVYEKEEYPEEPGTAATLRTIKPDYSDNYIGPY